VCAGLAEANAFGSNENLVNHGRNIGIGWNHVFSPRALKQATLGYDRIFDYIASLGNYTCESAILEFRAPIWAALQRYLELHCSI